MYLIGNISLACGLIMVLIALYREKYLQIPLPLLLFVLGMGISYFGWVELLPEKFNGIARPELMGAVIGFLVTHMLGPLIPMIKKKYIEPDLPDPTSDMTPETYDNLIRTGNRGGFIIGVIERTLYFISLIVNPLYIGALLTFKIAAKWEAWKNIVKVPGESGESLISEHFNFRFKLGGYYMTSLVTLTFSNILFAAIGYGFYKWVLKVS